jgi:CheY-like chemotaxis protein
MPAVLADPTQIHQVILNLCTNAAHAIGDRPGRLEVELDVIDLSRELALDPDLVVGRHVRMSITDDGVGMDRATIERIFDPFFTTKPLGQGTGLGLAVVHGIVRSHDGAIRAYSEPGKGSKFSVYLPAIETPMGSGPSESTEAPAGHGEHVVVVDDEAMLVEVSRRLLERLGYRVTGVGSAAEALALVQADPDRVDLVLTDLTMPGMSGADLARHLAALRGDLPVILITGFGTARQAEAARRAGVREILMKPATLKSLGDAVHRALSTVESEAVRK